MHLLVAAPPDLLYYNWAEMRNGTKEYFGLVFDILQSLGNAYNFTYEVLDAESYGLAEDGLTSMLYNERVNMSVGSIGPSYQRHKYVDFLTSFWEDDVTFATYITPPKPDIFLAIRPFNFYTSLALVATWILSSVALCLIMIGNCPTTNIWQSMIDVTYEMFGTALRQSVIKLNKASSNRIRLILACWNILVLIVTTLYVSLLVALAAVPPEPPTIDSFSELAQRLDYQVIVHDDTVAKETFRVSTAGAMADVWKNQMSPYPENFISFSDPESSIIERLSTTKSALVVDREYLLSLKSKYCFFHVAKHRAFGMNWVFAVRKNFFLTEKFNDHILSLVESGVISKWVSTYYEKFFNVTKCKTEKQTASPIVIQNILGPMNILILGVAFAVGVFTIEYVHARFKRKSYI